MEYTRTKNKRQVHTQAVLFEPVHSLDNMAVSDSVQQYISIPEFKMTLEYKQAPKERHEVKSSRDAADIIRQILKPTIEWRETFVMLALNRKNCVLNYSIISEGGVTGTVADPRVIMQFALAMNATFLILAHNHPSGNIKPSRPDEDLTKKICEAAKLFDITIMDHIIVTAREDVYFSFLDENLL